METLCSKSTNQDYNNLNCLYRKCEKCGVMGFKTRDEETDMSDDAPKVKWRKFEYVVETNDHDDSEKRKLKMVDKITSPGEMFSC